jgi:hypothetical protein
MVSCDLQKFLIGPHPSLFKAIQNFRSSSLKIEQAKRRQRKIERRAPQEVSENNRLYLHIADY